MLPNITFYQEVPAIEDPIYETAKSLEDE